jgi:hypothetical protein
LYEEGDSSAAPDDYISHQMVSGNARYRIGAIAIDQITLICEGNRTVVPLPKQAGETIRGETRFRNEEGAPHVLVDVGAPSLMHSGPVKG